MTRVDPDAVSLLSATVLAVVVAATDPPAWIAGAALAVIVWDVLVVAFRLSFGRGL